MSDRPETSARPYLHPFPAGVVRRGLNTLAQLGEEFRDDDAVADIMLDLDAVEGGRSKARGKTGLPHAYSYYAVRWSWSKTRVARALKGEGDAGPWARERAAEWRTFFGRVPERFGTPRNDTGTKHPSGGAKKGDLGTPRNDSGTIRNGIDQTPDLHTEREGGSGARAREAAGAPSGERPHGEARPRGEAYQSEAVAIYQLVTGAWPAPFHAEAVARRFANSTPSELTAWAEHVTTYHTSPGRNERNVPGIIQTFDEHLARETLSREQTIRAADSPPGAAAQPGGSAGRPDRRSARERTNQLSHADLEQSALDSLALLRSRPSGGHGGDPDAPGASG